jgi:dynein heavy chain
LEDAIHTFEEAKAGITTRTYDYLDQRDMEFDADFDVFLEKTDKLKECIGTLIEENFASVWETPQGIRFLTRFEKVDELLCD